MKIDEKAGSRPPPHTHRQAAPHQPKRGESPQNLRGVLRNRDTKTRTLFLGKRILYGAASVAKEKEEGGEGDWRPASLPSKGESSSAGTSFSTLPNHDATRMRTRVTFLALKELGGSPWRRDPLLGRASRRRDPVWRRVLRPILAPLGRAGGGGSAAGIMDEAYDVIVLGTGLTVSPPRPPSPRTVPRPTPGMAPAQPQHPPRCTPWPGGAPAPFAKTLGPHPSPSTPMLLRPAEVQAPIAPCMVHGCKKRMHAPNARHINALMHQCTVC